MKQPTREPPLGDAIAMVVGVGMIAAAHGFQLNQLQYLPGDVRGEPWFDPASGIFFTVVGLFVFVVASIRLLQGLRARRK